MDFVAFVSQLYGRGEETAHRLRSAGYSTPERLSRLTPEKLSTITGLSASSSKGIIVTATEMWQQGKKQRKNALAEIEGVGDRRAKRLRKAGLRTVKAVARAKEERLARLLKVPTSTARRIIESAQKIEGSVRSAGMTAEETEVLATGVVPPEKRTKEESTVSSEWVQSFWEFG